MSLDLLGAPARFTDRAHGQPMQMASNDCGNSPISIDLARGIRHMVRVVTSPFFTAEVLFTGGWLACLARLARPKTNNALQTENVTCPAHRAIFLLPKPQAEENLFLPLPALRLRQSKPPKKPFRHSQLTKTKKDGASQVTPGPLRSIRLVWLVGWAYIPV